MTSLLTELDRMVPLRSDAAGDWVDVVRRAGRAAPARRRPPRALVLAVTLCAALTLAGVATPLGHVVTHAVTSFSGWLSGDPGKPVSAAEQARFERTHRSWQSFPGGTALRRLADVRAAGSRFVLDGYRTRDSLCLQLVVRGALRHGRTSCAPLRDLKSRSEPALPLLVDEQVGTLGKPVRSGPQLLYRLAARVNAGIVGDGVRDVRLASTDGTQHALVAGDAYLSVDVRPPLDTRLAHLTARTAKGTTVRVSFARAPTDPYDLTALASTGRATGPTKVEHVLASGHIGWLDRHEPRGRPLSRAALRQLFHRQFGRAIQPDPTDPAIVHVGVSRKGRLTVYCTELNGGSGCLRPGWIRKSIDYGGAYEAGGQYELASGLVPDGVATLRVYLRSGAWLPVALRDNVYLVHVPRTEEPVRLVAYDAQHRVVSSFTDEVRAPVLTLRRPAHWHVVLRTSRLGASRGLLMAAAGTHGSTCYSEGLGLGNESGFGCEPAAAPRKLQLGWGGGDVRLVSGRVPVGVRVVHVRLPSGRVLRLRVVEGHVLGIYLHEEGDPRSAVGLDAVGRIVARVRLAPAPGKRARKP